MHVFIEFKVEVTSVVMLHSVGQFVGDLTKCRLYLDGEVAKLHFWNPFLQLCPFPAE